VWTATFTARFPLENAKPAALATGFLIRAGI
jgi:hypothetical protein